MKRLATLIIFTLLVQLSLALPSNAQPAQPGTPVRVAQTRFAKQVKTFDDFVQKQMAIDKTPGLTIGFMEGDEEWVKAYGYSDLENKVAAKADSAYRLASVSKSMTAVAILQLVEKGKINLDAEVQTYVPYFPKKQWPVTVRQLLGHLGGISHYKNPANELHIKEHKTTREAIAIFENFDLIAEPGTRYSYSSYGYNLLGAIVEAASGMSYGDYLRQNVWGPAGMTNTRMDDPFEVIPNRVRGYQLVSGQVRNSEFVDISSRFGGGGTRSTVPDLLKYAKATFAGKLLASATMNEMATSMSTRAGLLTNYGMGWETTPYQGRYMLVHSGGQQETTTLLYLAPSRKLALAVAINFENSNPGAYLDRLFQLVTDSPRNVALYSADKQKYGLASAVNISFNYGLAYFDQMQKPLTTEDAQLVEAFAYFNKSVAADFSANSQDALKIIRDGAHPVAKQAYTKVGSYMAAQLQQKNGPAQLSRYQTSGGFAFFQDYIALANANQSIPPSKRFSESFVTMVNQMAGDWRKANSSYVNALWLMQDADLNVVGKNLRDSFGGSGVYPNLVEPLFALVRQAVLARNSARALEAGKLAFELYPETATATLGYGLALALNNDETRAVEMLKKSAVINPPGGASAGGLNNVAFQLGGAGLVAEAIAVLQTAIRIYPQEANLHDSLGEFQLKQGNKAKALESYKKALELNPEFANAPAAKEIVKKLSSELGGQ